MIEDSGPRKIIWLLGVLAVLGNLAVIAWRLIRRDDHRASFPGAYFNFDLTWRSGTLCKLAGALSVLSSEVSVLMLTVITADRLISIVFTFSCRRLTLKGSYVICAAVWVIGTRHCRRSNK
ncbi:unnamed protein product [Porites lobata]|uniref:G-protein coupled receptors family 1 profile domain-containing protein n=1 Tax=Porites lobata TaxID=104759 RepID=A0ABN8RJI0_9CNID|nr:unnamed protein product [Porites lobata]